MKFFIATYKPEFTGFDGAENVKVDNYKFIVGDPDCGSMQLWNIYNEVSNSHFKLNFSIIISLKQNSFPLAVC